MSFAEIQKQFYIESTLVDRDTGESIDISSYIEDVMVRKRFYTESFPLYVIDLLTTEEIRNKIRDNDVSIFLRMSSYDVLKNSIQQEDNQDIVPEDEVILETTLRLYEKPFVTSVSKKDEDNEESEKNNFSDSVPLIYYRVAGIPEELIEKNNKIINRVYNNATLSEILINIATEIEEEKKISIQEPLNKDQFKSLLIPPSTFVSTVNFLQDYYKMYSYSVGCFLDTQNIEIFDPGNIVGTNTVNLEVRDINETPDSDEYKKILFDSETNNLMFSLKSLPGIIDTRKITVDTVGTESIFYSYDDFFNLVKRTTKNSEYPEKIRYHWNPTKQKEREDALLERLRKSVGMSISLSGFNPELIRPTTVFSLNSSYDAVSGEYLPETVSYIFTTNDRKTYSSDMTISCIKR